MALQEDQLHVAEDGRKGDEFCSPIKNEKASAYVTPRDSTHSEGSLTVCRVCQCAESDRRGDAALGFLDIEPPSEEVATINEPNSVCLKNQKDGKDDVLYCGRKSTVTEFISPTGEVFVCNIDIEAGWNHHQDKLINLGCSCKNDLAIAHYACALKWFVNYGTTVCEICGSVAENVKPSDFEKVVASLNDYEKLMEKTVSGEPTSSYVRSGPSVDPDAVAGIRRQRLSEIALWFNIHINNNTHSSHSLSTTVSQRVIDSSSNNPVEGIVSTENAATKWAVEITGILVATGLLTVTLAWLIAPRVGKVCFLKFKYPLYFSCHVTLKPKPFVLPKVSSNMLPLNHSLNLLMHQDI